MNLESFDELLDAYLLGELSPEQSISMREALRTDAAARLRFVQSILIEAHLHRLGSSEVALETPCQTIQAGAQGHWAAAGIFRLRRLALAAVVLIAVGAAVVIYFARQEASTGEGARALVHVVSGNVRVDGQSRARIAEGSTFSVAGGAPATIKLSDGSQATLDPATQLNVRGRVEGTRQVLHLTAGGGQFRVTHGGGEFRIDTPAGSITVLGTEFTAVLRSPHSLFVSVAAGTVRWNHQGQAFTLGSGQSRTFGPEADTIPPVLRGVGTIESVDLKADRFVLIDKNESTMTFRVTPRGPQRETAFLLNGKRAGFKDAIHPNRSASVTYFMDGDQLLATKVEVTFAKDADTAE